MIPKMIEVIRLIFNIRFFFESSMVGANCIAEYPHQGERVILFLPCLQYSNGTP